MDPRYAAYYYSDDERGTQLPRWVLFGALLGGGILAYRAGLLRPAVQRALVLGSRWRPGVVQDITHGVHMWARATRGEPFFRSLRSLSGYVAASMREKMATRTVRPLLLQSTLRELRRVTGQLRDEWMRQLGAQGLPLEEVRRRAERGLEAVSALAREAVLERFTVPHEVQEALLRSAGVRLATVEDILRLDPERYPQFRRLRLLVSAYGIRSDPVRRAWVYVDPHLFVLPSGELVDVRHLAGRAATWIRALERHFAIPFVNFNPLSLYHIDKLLKLERQPVVHLFERGEIQPYLTGTTKEIGRALYVGGRVYSLEEIPQSVEELRSRIMNEGRCGILVPGQEFISLEYLRSMAGLPTRIYEPYAEGARGLMARAMRTAGIGFQDVYRWADVEIGLLGRDVAMEAGMTSIGEIYGRMAEAGWRVLRPWKSAVVPPEIQRYLQQQWIYLNAADLNSIASVLEQLFAGRRNLTRVTPLTLIPYIGVARMNVAAGTMGFGLPIEHTGSALDVFYNMFLRRAFILGALAFLWHYLNYEAENITGIRPEYVMADAYVRATEALSGLGEKAGLPDFVKRMGRLLPGSEQIAELPGIRHLTIWMGKTREEMEEYWERGEEPIRKGRWWPLGNTPFTGGRIQAWIPNWYRRLKSKWQYTDVLYGSEEEYFAHAPLPVPRFPLAPLRRYVLEPYWLEEKHYHDRPYLLTGDIPELVEFPLIGPLLTFISRLIKPQLRMHPEMWQLIESGIIPQDEGAKEVYVSPEELERGRPAPPSRYLVGKPRYPAPLIMPPPPPGPGAARATAARREARGAGEATGGLWGLEVTGALHAWREIPRGRDVVVAVIDTGVDRGHPDLRGQVLEGYNVIEDSRDVTDRAGHGTHVAGIIAALGNNGRGAVGAAFPAVKILPIKALSDEGLGRPEDIERAIEYAIRWRGPHGERVSVINLSLGAPVLSEQYAEAIKRAHEAGIVVVAAAGNEALWYSSSPAIWPEAISVAAVEEKERRRGRRVIEKAPYSNYGIGVDVAAPGTDILSTVPGRRKGEERYEKMSGTSMAAPFVAAAAALLKAVRPDLTPAEVHYLLTHAVRDLGPPGEDKLYGHGLLDIGTAVAVAGDLDEKELEKLTVQGLIHERNIEAQRFLLLNYMRNKLGNEVVGLINRRIVDQYGREVVQPGSPKDVLQRFWSNVAEMLGFYGFTMEAITETQEELRRDRELRMADARAISSFRRRFWRAEAGGLGGEVNEIIRRFIGRRERWEWMWNPIPNRMPSWLPGPEYIVDYHTGDPYIKAGPYGEILLPGGGYEALWHVPAAEIIKHHPILSEMEKAGLINRFEFYDPFNRFRVLAHVSPWSEEYRYYSKLMSQMKLDARQREEVKRLREQVRQMKKPLRLYPYRFRYLDLKTETVTVEKIIDQNTILVREYPEHPVRFAGIHVTMAEDEKASKEAMKWLQEHLKPGTKIRISYDPERKFAEDTYQTIRAVVWLGRLNVGRAMLLKGWAHEKEDDWSAPAVYTRFSWQERLIGRLWEHFCVSENQLIVTYDGLKQAKEVKPGDRVLTTDGDWHKVVYVHKRPLAESEKVYRIRTWMTGDALVLTGNHEVYAAKAQLCPFVKGSNGCRPGVCVPGRGVCRDGCSAAYKPTWIKAEELRKDDWVCLPIAKLPRRRVFDLVDYIDLSNKVVIDDRIYLKVGGFSPNAIRKSSIPVNRYIPVSRELYTLFGYYLSEGHIKLQRGKPVAVQFAFHINETEYANEVIECARKVFGVDCTVHYQSDCSVQIVHLGNSIIAEFFNALLGRTVEKRLSAEALTDDLEALKGLVVGYFRGDGHIDETVSCVSIQPNIIIPMRMVLLNLGFIPGLHIRETCKDANGTIHKRQYMLCISGKHGRELAKLLGKEIPSPKRETNGWAFIQDGVLFVRIKEVEEVKYEGKLVYDFTVEGNHSYTTLVCAVHNSHLDTPIHTKLLQVRSAYEDWIRREVYGKSFQRWERPWSDYVLPTYQSFIARPPFLAIASGMALGALFGHARRSRYGAVIGAVAGGLLVGAGSLYRAGYELLTGEKWIPARRRKEWEIEEYIDILKYVKYRRLFEREARRAREEENFDVLAYVEFLRQQKEARKARIEALREAKRVLYLHGNRVNLHELVRKYRITVLPEDGEGKKAGKRERLARRIIRSINAELEMLSRAMPDRTEELPPHARRAMEYYRLMKQTMYGYEPGEPLENFLAALPKKERRYFQYFLRMPREEYEKLKKVVPQWLLYGLAPMRGEEPPPKPSLEEYFERHFLPDESWPGWRPDVSLQDVKVKLVQHEAMDTAEFDVWPEDVARAGRSPAPAPRAFRPAEHGRRLQERLRRLLSGLGVDDLDVMVEPADRDLFIEVDLEYDPRDEIAQLINADPAVLLRE